MLEGGEQGSVGQYLSPGWRLDAHKDSSMPSVPSRGPGEAGQFARLSEGAASARSDKGLDSSPPEVFPRYLNNGSFLSPSGELLLLPCLLPDRI